MAENKKLSLDDQKVTEQLILEDAETTNADGQKVKLFQKYNGRIGREQILDYVRGKPRDAVFRALLPVYEKMVDENIPHNQLNSILIDALVHFGPSTLSQAEQTALEKYSALYEAYLGKEVPAHSNNGSSESPRVTAVQENLASEKTLWRFYNAYLAEPSDKNRTALIDTMFENLGYDGPTERLIASEHLFKTNKPLYQAFMSLRAYDNSMSIHTPEKQGPGHYKEITEWPGRDRNRANWDEVVIPAQSSLEIDALQTALADYYNIRSQLEERPGLSDLVEPKREAAAKALVLYEAATGDMQYRKRFKSSDPLLMEAVEAAAEAPDFYTPQPPSFAEKHSEHKKSDVLNKSWQETLKEIHKKNPNFKATPSDPLEDKKLQDAWDGFHAVKASSGDRAELRPELARMMAENSFKHSSNGLAFKLAMDGDIYHKNPNLWQDYNNQLKQLRAEDRSNLPAADNVYIGR